MLICVHAQPQQYNRPSLKFNPPYTTSNNRSVILPSDRIPNDFLGCSVGITTEVDALKNLNKLGIRYTNQKQGISDIITIDGDIECEGAKFHSYSMWFYDNKLWKICFNMLLSDRSQIVKTLYQKYSKMLYSTSGNDPYKDYKYRGNGIDLVINLGCLQYITMGASEGATETNPFYY